MSKLDLETAISLLWDKQEENVRQQLATTPEFLNEINDWDVYVDYYLEKDGCEIRKDLTEKANGSMDVTLRFVNRAQPGIVIRNLSFSSHAWWFPNHCIRTTFKEAFDWVKKIVSNNPKD